MSPSLISPSAPPVPNPWHAFGGVWRLTFRRFFAPGQWLPVLIGLAILAVVEGATIREGRVVPYYAWAAEFYLAFLVPILAFLSGAGAIRDELKAGSVDYIFTRPVRRPVFLVFKFLAHVACIQAIFLLGLGELIAVGVFRHIPQLAATLPWLLLGQIITVTAFTALGFFCGLLTSRYLVIGLSYGAVIEGGIGHIPIALNRLSMTHQVAAMLAPVLPGRHAALMPMPDQGAFATIGILLAYAAIMLALAAIVFSFQELAGARPSET